MTHFPLLSCHPRVGGDPKRPAEMRQLVVDPRLRGDDNRVVVKAATSRSETLVCPLKKVYYGKKEKDLPDLTRTA
jgi:hypothetical protein